LIGTLAISGIPPFAGFWSKDEILSAAFAVNPLLWGVGWLTAGITAFYMFRMYISTFEGEFRGHDISTETLKRLNIELSHHDGGHAHDAHSTHAQSPHESPWVMTLPLLILAVPSVLIGLLGTPFANYFEAFIHPTDQVVPDPLEGMAASDWNEFLIMAGTSVAISLLSIILALLMYLIREIDPGAIATRIKPLYLLSLNKWYIDDIYNTVFVQTSRRLARQVLAVDIKIVDGIVNLAGLVTLVFGEGLKYLENGRVQFYALIVFGTVLSLVLFSIVM
jgi:NAD(P)H-quinone oxidoreductase subunit 5